MIPLNWSANVRLPYHGWFGGSGFATKADARAWLARQYRAARREGGMFKPAYASRDYTLRPYVLQNAD